MRFSQVRSIWKFRCLRRARIREIVSFSTLTCVQQSVMNLGILMVQGLVNSFGAVVMAAFAAAVKIDAFAYMPVQDFGNAFSTFIAQNYGAKERARIRAGLKSAVCISMAFCIVISILVCVFARPLMAIFVDAGEAEIIQEGVRYLRIEGAFYCGIGCLFLLYGLYRALGRPGMRVTAEILPVQFFVRHMSGKGVIERNRRTYIAENVDPERTHLNLEYCYTPIEQAYHELFDEALAAYNAKQKRKDRCIENYYKKICDGDQEKPFYEVIFQIGNKDDIILAMDLATTKKHGAKCVK